MTQFGERIATIIYFKLKYNGSGSGSTNHLAFDTPMAISA